MPIEHQSWYFFSKWSHLNVLLRFANIQVHISHISKEFFIHYLPLLVKPAGHRPGGAMQILYHNSGTLNNGQPLNNDHMHFKWSKVPSKESVTQITSLQRTK